MLDVYSYLSCPLRICEYPAWDNMADIIMQAPIKNTTGETISLPSSEKTVKSNSPALDALRDYFRHRSMVLDAWLTTNKMAVKKESV